MSGQGKYPPDATQTLPIICLNRQSSASFTFILCLFKKQYFLQQIKVNISQLHIARAGIQTHVPLVTKSPLHKTSELW